MSNPGSVWAKTSPFLLSILRVVLGLMFMQHGVGKLFGFGGGHTVQLLSLMGLAGVLEFFGGLLVLLGLGTRPVAFILSGEMAFAYFMVHAPQSPWPLFNGGGMAVAFCFGFLYLSAAGGAAWSLDRLLRRG